MLTILKYLFLPKFYKQFIDVSINTIYKQRKRGFNESKKINKNRKKLF